MRKAFIETLEKLCEVDNNIFLLSADLGFKLFDRFRKKYPDKFLNMGIAEPNMIGIAAGLALSGKKVYCYSMIPFLIMRCVEHIRIDVCYNALDVRLIGVGCGLTYGPEGVTHHAIEDLAMMRSLPNMTVVAPGDPCEVSACIDESSYYKGPMFIRLGRSDEPQVHPYMPNFQIGKGITLFDKGHDICILATGSMLYKAKITSELLLKRGFGITLISLHTIKPLDEMLIRNCAKKYKSIFTIEEHSIIGGLGSAVAEVLSEIHYDGLFKRIGLPDKFNQYVGKTEYLHKEHGILSEDLADSITKLIKEAQVWIGK